MNYKETNKKHREENLCFMEKVFFNNEHTRLIMVVEFVSFMV